ncbi:uncharacterized protein LOC119545693 [Drosophila subpulchrella]|uniref:uncharacterized protein LOC119545693 n=1 Tax=Drosophila subpulchrella TaxID=1486046 RepID=UPI0018A14F55|nr:uncharacterized protein LOC119545693 [Drosophila subpulchrella]
MKLQQVRMIYKGYCMLAFVCLIHPSISSVIKDSVKCTEGFVAVDADDCASYFQCLDDETVHFNCPNGSYFEKNNEICVVDEFGVCPTSRRKCFNGDLFEDSKDCVTYFKCLHGNLVRERCPDGSNFNGISKSCRMDHRGSCTSQREICVEGELQADSDDCAGYLNCIGGVLVKEKCPSGSYFEPIFKLCQLDENGVCSSPSSECNEGEVQVDPSNCAGYLNCQNGKLETESCPSGSYFEPTYKVCTVDLNGVCVKPPAKCTEGQLTLDPNNCAGYLKCIDGEFVEEQCSSGSFYDPKLETCLVDSEGVCVTKIKHCNEGVREEDPQNCAGYTQCIQGKTENLKCSFGSYFNETQGECLFDLVGVCVKSIDELDISEVEPLYSKSTIADFERQTESTTSDQSTETTMANLIRYAESLVVDLSFDMEEVQPQYTESTTANIEQHTDSTTPDQRTETTIANLLRYTESTATDLPGYTEGPEHDERTSTDLPGYTEGPQYAKANNAEISIANLLQYTESTTSDWPQISDSSLADLLEYQYTENTVSDWQSTNSALQSSTSNEISSPEYAERSNADFTQYSTTSDWPSSTESSLADLLEYQYTESTVSGWQTTDSALQSSTSNEISNSIGNTSTIVPDSTICIEYSIEEDPDDCAGYRQCIRGEIKQVKCDQGRYFNITQGDCLIDVNKVCAKLQKEDQDQYAKINVTDSPTTISALETTTPYDPFAKCTEGRLKMDPNNCAGYLNCSDGELKAENCPSGFYFDPKLKICSVDIRATCITNIKFCVDGVREEDPNNCAGYRQCTQGVVVNLKCPNGKYFNVAERGCLADEHKVCVKSGEDYYPEDVLLDDSAPPMFLPEQTCSTYKNGVCADPLEKCFEGQLKLDPNNCAGYLICKFGQLVQELCPKGSYFDPSTKSCLVDRRGICVTNIEICEEGAREEDPQDCAGYRQCIQGDVENLKCPAGNYFNVPQRECLVDIDKVCEQTEQKFTI